MRVAMGAGMHQPSLVERAAFDEPQIGRFAAITLGVLVLEFLSIN